MRKIILLILAMILALSLFTACGGNGGDSSNYNHLTLKITHQSVHEVI